MYPGAQTIKTPAPALAQPSAPSELKLREGEYSSVTEYRENMQQARRNLATKLKDAFRALDELTDKEFLEIMKTLEDGVIASDMLERFRRYKETGKAPGRKKRVNKDKEPTKASS